MSENKKENHFALDQVIEKKLNLKCSFHELSPDKQLLALLYIKKKKLDIKVFDSKYYDILINKFYTIEYVLEVDEDNEESINKDKKEFATFEEFYQYTKGDIYDNRTCLYGYKFSNEEIEKYHLNIGELNFDSLIGETIDDHTFEKLTSEKVKQIQQYQDKVAQIQDWFRKLETPTTLRSLEQKCRFFVKKFDDGRHSDDWPRFVHFSYQEIFFSLLLRRDKEKLKDLVIMYFCKNGIYDGISFSDIVMTYGRDAALKTIENFDGKYAESTKKQKIREFKKILKECDEGHFAIHKRIGFYYDTFYAVQNSYEKDSIPPLVKKECFLSFDELVSFVDGDLRGADLSLAPLEKEEILKYKTDEYTIMPKPMKYDKHELVKTYENNEFIVGQRWSYRNDEALIHREEFSTFFDFSHYLKKDLSNADLILCDGLERIKEVDGLNLKGLKVRSHVARELNLPLDRIPDNQFQLVEFDQTNHFELDTKDELLAVRPDDDGMNAISYVTDIHLMHRFMAYKCESLDDQRYVIKKIAKKIIDESTNINLIGGDTSSEFDVFCSFIEELKHYRASQNHKMSQHFFFTLGNHELWEFSHLSLRGIVDTYKKVLSDNDEEYFHLIQNDLYYYEPIDMVWNLISQDELREISISDLRERTRSSSVILFGGIGFAGQNEEFNANNGIYRSTLSREDEQMESRKFVELYEKVTDALHNRNLVILTHMPIQDWAGKESTAKPGIIYVNGHSHRNYYHDDGIKRIFADNQVGYRGKEFSLKKIPFDNVIDWFADYEDGIHEITAEDYKRYYRGIRQAMNFNRKFMNLYMIKKENTYMFLMRNTNGNLQILAGGNIKLAIKPLEYYYEHLTNYAESIKLYLSEFNAYLSRISHEVSRIGGNGNIHGCIVDIDFYNHLFVNPFDRKVTPYYALSMTDKFVYDNIPSLLNDKCQGLYIIYENLINDISNKDDLILYEKDAIVTKHRKYNSDTTIYSYSKIIKGLQYTTYHNLVRIWNDEFIDKSSEKNGLQIVKSLLSS